jgi:hypothetical protein
MPNLAATTRSAQMFAGVCEILSRSPKRRPVAENALNRRSSQVIGTLANPIVSEPGLIYCGALTICWNGKLAAN